MLLKKDSLRVAETKISLVFLYYLVNAMNCLTLRIITLVTAKNLVLCNLCNNYLTKGSIVFSITTHGKLPGELLFTVSKDIVEDCLYACTQHLTCLTINYHTPYTTIPYHT